MTRLCQELAEYFRGLMLIKTMKDASRLVLCSSQELEVMTGQALTLSLSTILHGLDTFEETCTECAMPTSGQSWRWLSCGCAALSWTPRPRPFSAA